jgi:hypothetical protein
MKGRTTVILLATAALLALLWAAGGVIAGPPVQERTGELPLIAQGGEGLAAPLPIAVLYQGRLWDDQTQQWVTGQRNITFSIYDDPSAGQQLWSETKTGVVVRNGLFGVTLNVDQTLFNGQGLWLEVQVEGDPEPLSPRTALLPVPYALGLVPGATVQGETATAMLRVLNEGTSVGLLDIASHGIHATSSVTGTAGVYGSSAAGYGVEGYSSNNIGVFGHSGWWFEHPPRPAGQYGVLGLATSDHGVVGQTESDDPDTAGVYGQSTTLMAEGVRGQGGTGVHGIGYTGVHGEGDVGVHGTGLGPGVLGEGAVGVRGEGMAGVQGEGTQVGVDGSATDYNAIGVEGSATFGTGVKGSGETGIHGESSVGIGVLGEGAFGVRGSGTTGVDGEGTQAGVYGSATDYNAIGVEGRATFGTGVKGSGETGVHGESSVGVGVLGEGSTGVSGQSTVGYGVSGMTENANGAGVYAEGAGESSPDLILGGTSGSNDNGLLSSASWLDGSDLIFRSNDEFYLYLDYNGDEEGQFRIYSGAAGPTWTMVFRVDEAGNMWAAGSKAGYVVDIVRNGGTEPLRAGDVVTVIGVEPPLDGQAPIMVVRRATAAYDTGVVGVVDQGYVPEKAADVEGAITGFVPLAEEGAAVEPGDYLSVVTHGAFRCARVDADYGTIRPGDLLVSSPTPGHAMKAAEPKLGTLLGKALGSLESGTGTIPVLVTLQ